MFLRRIWLSLGLVGLELCLAPEVRAQRPYNLDFEMPSFIDAKLPWGWSWWDGDAAGTDILLDSTVQHHGRHSLRVHRTKGADGPISLGFNFRDPSVFPGKRLRLSGWIRTSGVKDGEVGFTVVYAKPGHALIDSMPARGASGTTRWKRYTVEVPVDSVGWVTITLHMSGSGTAWFDALEMDIDGHPIEGERTPGTTVSSAEMNWLRRTATPLSRVDASDDVSDLVPLKAIAGDAHVIALGEASHGTSEFFRMKHRVIEYFASELGVTLVAIEANQLEAERVNRYVLGGAGDGRVAISGLFGVWRTAEMLDFVQWMRRYNASGRSRIEFVGYDMQDPRLPIDSLHRFLERVDPDYAPSADSAYHSMRQAWSEAEYPTKPDSVLASWNRGAATVLAHMMTRRDAYLRQIDTAQVAWAIQNANVALQASLLNYRAPTPSRSGQVRDSCMAVNLLWHLARRPASTRVVVWAHNGHVARIPGRMGSYLDQARGIDYRIIGLATYQGTYSASAFVPPPERRYLPTTLYPSPPRSVDYLLHQLAMPQLVLDLRRARSDTLGRFLLEPRLIHYGGWVRVEWAFDVQPVATVYDALIFIDRTTASTMLACPSDLSCGG